MTDSITLTNGPHELAWQPLDVAFGVSREVARPTPGLLVFRDTRDGQQILIAETTENRSDAPASLDYVLEVNGVRCECKGHKRLRRTWWLVKGAWLANGTELIQPNGLTWDGPWRSVKPMSVEPVVPKGDAIPPGTDTRATGARPCLGVRAAWGRDAIACIEAGKVYGHLPITLRDPTTLQLVRDNSISLGYNPSGVKGVSVSTLGMKMDTAHAWSALEGYLAARGTVLERYYAEIVEALAVYSCMSDYGNLWKKELRGAGRSIRAAVDWLSLLRYEMEPFVESHLSEVWEHYEYAANHSGFLSCHNGIRFAKENYHAVAGFEWAQLLYGMWLTEKYLNSSSQFLRDALNWFAKFPGIPYQIQMSDATGKSAPLWPIDKVIAEEAKKFAVEPTRYDQRLPEQYVMDVIRYDLGLPTTRPLDDPKYKAAMATANSAGFALPWKPKPPFTVEVSTGETIKRTPVFSADDAALLAWEGVKYLVDEHWDGTADFEVNAKIEVTK